ncbi:hypothetical protein TNCT_420541 [Trichonephila clavata]|uniref:Uncharacterized protein n=1 Tax=Trichonephila clavata TaxID=2740835 RepID=A0A8X6LNT8_TRICU|nr:hypothetical protein TNCT_420541 [Trichonephila clavata]
MLWKDLRHSSAPTDLLFRCTRDGPNMTRPSSHVGGGVAKHSSRKEMTFTVLWKDSEHSSGPTNLTFGWSRDGPPMSPPSSRCGVCETLVPKRKFTEMLKDSEHSSGYTVF